MPKKKHNGNSNLYCNTRKSKQNGQASTVNSSITSSVTASPAVKLNVSQSVSLASVNTTLFNSQETSNNAALHKSQSDEDFFFVEHEHCLLEDGEEKKSFGLK